MLLVFGLAVAGVLVEAFVPRPRRRGIHLVLTLGGLTGAFVLTVVIAATVIAVRQRQPRACRGDGRGGGGRADPVHLGHDPGARLRQRAAHRGVLARCEPVRGPGRGHPGQRGGARGAAGRHHAHRGLPADAVRGRRHAAVPGVQ